MSDLDVLTDLLDRAGVVYTVGPCGEAHWDGLAQRLDIGTMGGPNNIGHSWFSARFYFDSEGKLLGTGVWE